MSINPKSLYRLFFAIIIAGLFACDSRLGVKENQNQSHSKIKKDSLKNISLSPPPLPVSKEVDCGFSIFLKSKSTPPLAKEIMQDKDWDLNQQTEALALFDSLNSKNVQSRRFYFKVLTKAKKNSDGYFSEGLGLAGSTYVEDHKSEFLHYFEDTVCFPRKDLETWAEIVLLELTLAGASFEEKKILPIYIDKLRKEEKNLSSKEKTILYAFNQILRDKSLNWIQSQK